MGVSRHTRNIPCINRMYFLSNNHHYNNLSTRLCCLRYSVPLQNGQNKVRLNFGINNVTYNYVLGFTLNRAYVFDLSLDATPNFD